MKNTVSVTEAQKQLPRLLKSNEITTVMRHNEVAAFLVPKERFEALIETMHTLANPEAMKAIKKYQAGEMSFTPLSDFQKEFGL